MCHVVRKDSSAIKFWQSLNHIYFLLCYIGCFLASHGKFHKEDFHMENLHFLNFCQAINITWYSLSMSSVFPKEFVIDLLLAWHGEQLFRCPCNQWIRCVKYATSCFDIRDAHLQETGDAGLLYTSTCTANVAASVDMGKNTRFQHVTILHRQHNKNYDWLGYNDLLQ